MEQKIDIDRLREDILDYYGTAMFNDFAIITEQPCLMTSPWRQ